MQEHYPVPNHLRPEAARWKQNADGSEAVSLAGVQSLYEVVIENVSKPDFYRQIAEKMRANPEVTYLDMTSGVISQYVFDSICTLTNLEWLSLGQVRASDISNLRNLNSLRCLSIDCFRYALFADIPLNGTDPGPGSVYLALYNEIFVNAQRDIGDGRTVELFDRNRSYAALGYGLQNGMRVQFGYMHQESANFGKGQLQISLHHNF